MKDDDLISAILFEMGRKMFHELNRGMMAFAYRNELRKYLNNSFFIRTGNN